MKEAKDCKKTRTKESEVPLRSSRNFRHKMGVLAKGCSRKEAERER